MQVQCTSYTLVHARTLVLAALHGTTWNAAVGSPCLETVGQHSELIRCEYRRDRRPDRPTSPLLWYRGAGKTRAGRLRWTYPIVLMSGLVNRAVL